MQGVADLFADILYSGDEDEDGLVGEEEEEEEWEGKGKLEGKWIGLGERHWGEEMEWGGRGEARGARRERLPRSESSSPHKLHPARWASLYNSIHVFFL